LSDQFDHLISIEPRIAQNIVFVQISLRRSVIATSASI